MKISKMALVAAIGWGIYAGNAALANDYYYQPDNSASPSDQQVAPQAMKQAYAPAQAPGHAPCADECAEPVCEPWRLFCQDECGWNFHGWINGGFMLNSRDNNSNFNGVTTFPDRDEGQINQLYGIFEKKVNTGGCGWDVGGRADFLYGTDFVFTQATGLELTDDDIPSQRLNGSPFLYGLAIPQLYGEVGYNDLSVKIGHFYTNIGYEGVMAPGQFFYSHPYTHQYGEPFTHTGALANYAYSDTTNVLLGIVNGWDHFDRQTDTGAALFGLTWDGGNALSFNFSGIFSPNEAITLGPLADPAAPILTNRNLISFVATYDINDCWTYVYQSDVGWQHDANSISPGRSAEWYSVNQYLFYTINDCWKAGMRFEWFRDDDGARVTGVRPGNPVEGEFFVGDFYELSFGLNYTPSANLTVRPEVRYDWTDIEASSGPIGPFGDGDRPDQLLFGFDAIYLF